MDIKLDFSKEKFGRVSKSFSGFWKRRNVWIFLVFWLLFAGLMFWVWMDKLYQYEWNETEKEEYRKENGEGVILNEKEQRIVLDSMSQRQERYGSYDQIFQRDIFGIE